MAYVLSLETSSDLRVTDHNGYAISRSHRGEFPTTSGVAKTNAESNLKPLRDKSGVVGLGLDADGFDDM